MRQESAPEKGNLHRREVLRARRADLRHGSIALRNEPPLDLETVREYPPESGRMLTPPAALTPGSVASFRSQPFVDPACVPSGY